MHQKAPTTVRFAVEFADRGVAGSLLEALSGTPDLEVSIVRGRITRGGTWFEVQICGFPEQIEQIVKRSHLPGVSVWPIIEKAVLAS